MHHNKRKITHTMESILGNSGELLGGCAIAVVSFLYGRVKAWNKHHKQGAIVTRTGVQRTMSIDNLLTEVRIKLGADRALICQFKNGEYYSSGESVQKLVMTHCVCRIGISFPIVNSHSEAIKVSFISKLLIDLMEHKQLSFPVNDLPDSFYLKSSWMLNGTMHADIAGMFNAHGKLMGLLAVNYVTSPVQSDNGHKLTEAAGLIAANLMS